MLMRLLVTERDVHALGTQLRAHLLRQPGERATRHAGRDGRHPRLVPADAGVEDRRAGLHDGACELHRLVPVPPQGTRSIIDSR
jgi:hypothetical protein